MAKGGASTKQLIQKLSIKKIKNTIPFIWKGGRVPMVSGPPGVGKSEIVKQLASDGKFRIRDNPFLRERSAYLGQFLDQVMQNRPVHDVRLILMNPTDIKGIPVYDAQGKQALWIQTGSFPMATEELDRLEARLEANYATLEKYGFLPRLPNGDVARKEDGSLDFKKGKLPKLSTHDLDWVVAPEGKEGSNSLIHTVGEIVAETINFEHRVAQGLVQQHGIIFLDEITIAPKMVQGAALQLVLDRQAGTYRVPDGVDIVCAGNRTADKVGAGVMTPALASRLVHLHVAEPRLKEWMEDYAAEAGVSMEVLGFLQFKTSMFFDYDPMQMTGSEDAPSTFASPRTWVMASDLIKSGILSGLTEEESMAVLGGTVGDAVSAAFHAWYAIYRKLPSPYDILDGKINDVDFRKIAATANDPGSDDIRATSLKYAFIFLLMETLMEREQVRDLSQNLRTKKEELAKYIKRFDNFCKFITKEKKDSDWAFLVTLRVLKTLKAENAMGLLAALRQQIPELEGLLMQGNGTGGVGIQVSGGKK